MGFSLGASGKATPGVPATGPLLPRHSRSPSTEPLCVKEASFADGLGFPTLEEGGDSCQSIAGCFLVRASESHRSAQSSFSKAHRVTLTLLLVPFLPVCLTQHSSTSLFPCSSHISLMCSGMCSLNFPSDYHLVHSLLSGP